MRNHTYRAEVKHRTPVSRQSAIQSREGSSAALTAGDDTWWNHNQHTCNHYLLLPLLTSPRRQPTHFGTLPYTAVLPAAARRARGMSPWLAMGAGLQPVLRGLSKVVPRHEPLPAAVPAGVPVQPPTPVAEVERILAGLDAAKGRWTAVSCSERAKLLSKCVKCLLKVRVHARGACHRQGRQARGGGGAGPAACVGRACDRPLKRIGTTFLKARGAGEVRHGGQVVARHHNPAARQLVALLLYIPP